MFIDEPELVYYDYYLWKWKYVLLFKIMDILLIYFRAVEVRVIVVFYWVGLEIK